MVWAAVSGSVSSSPPAIHDSIGRPRVLAADPRALRPRPDDRAIECKTCHQPRVSRHRCALKREGYGDLGEGSAELAGGRRALCVDFSKQPGLRFGNPTLGIGCHMVGFDEPNQTFRLLGGQVDRGGPEHGRRHRPGHHPQCVAESVKPQQRAFVIQCTFNRVSRRMTHPHSRRQVHRCRIARMQPHQRVGDVRNAVCPETGPREGAGDRHVFVGRRRCRKVAPWLAPLAALRTSYNVHRLGSARSHSGSPHPALLGEVAERSEGRRRPVSGR